jgi:hypothetical protein
MGNHRSSAATQTITPPPQQPKRRLRVPKDHLVRNILTNNNRDNDSNSSSTSGNGINPLLLPLPLPLIDMVMDYYRSVYDDCDRLLLFGKGEDDTLLWSISGNDLYRYYHTYMNKPTTNAPLSPPLPLPQWMTHGTWTDVPWRWEIAESMMSTTTNSVGTGTGNGNGNGNEHGKEPVHQLACFSGDTLVDCIDINQHILEFHVKAPNPATTSRVAVNNKKRAMPINQRQPSVTLAVAGAALAGKLPDGAPQLNRRIRIDAKYIPLIGTRSGDILIIGKLAIEHT